MMGYWKDKVLPMFKKVFDKSGSKKAAAADACKAFDDSKEEMSKELEEKREELAPKVLEIYQASTAAIKGLVKDCTEAGVKKQSSDVNKLLEDLAGIGFPGSKKASELSFKYGPTLISGPVFFIFEKVFTFLPLEEQESSPPTGGGSVEEHRRPPVTSVSEEKVEDAEEMKEEEVKEREIEVASPVPGPPSEEPTVASPVVPPEVREPAVAPKGESEAIIS